MLEDTYSDEEKLQLASVILICFPKAGSTWIQMMLAQYLEGRYGCQMRSVKHLFVRSLHAPGIDATLRTHDDGPHFKAVSELERDKSRYRDKKVIFLVRDPRDVIVSYYFWYTRRKLHEHHQGKPFEGSIDEFVFNPVGGLPTLIAFYNLWLQNRHVPRSFLLLEYEQVRRDPYGEMRKVLNMMGERDVSEAHLKHAIEVSHFDRMRQLEEEGAAGLSRPAEVGARDFDGFKTRRGVMGGYVDYLDPRTIAKMDAYIDAELSEELATYKRVVRLPLHR